MSDKKKKESAKATIVSGAMEEFRLMSDQGTELKDDIRLSGFETALQALNELAAAEEGPGFNYELAPLIPGVGAGREYVPQAFLKWVQKSKDKEGDFYNVSKAFRRMQAYVAFLEGNKEYLNDLTLASGMATYNLLKTQVMKADGKNGQVVRERDIYIYIYIYIYIHIRLDFVFIFVSFNSFI